ncbi:MAG TPA: hypothetical protein VHZ04_00795 [Candidatus Paceibacterota bacterium]|nr:hypothetical protein [Candidatus Paceibacterota bacterium]
MRVLEETSGVAPVGKGHTPGVKRAYYEPAMSRAIINTASPAIQERLGFPVAIDVTEVENPMEAAQKAVEIFGRYGYFAKIIDDLETGLRKGFMAFVIVRELPHYALLYWPMEKNVTPEELAEFRAQGEFGPWTQADGAID